MDFYRRNPEKRHTQKGSALHRTRFMQKGAIVLPCKVLLFDDACNYEGAASLYNRFSQSTILYWRELFYRNSTPTNWIIPIHRWTERRISLGSPYMFWKNDGSICIKEASSLAQKNSRKLEVILQEFKNALTSAKPEKRELTSCFKGLIKNFFSEASLERAKNNGKYVLYSELELKLPIVQ